MQQAAGDVQPLAHAPGVALDPLALAPGQPDEIQQLADQRTRFLKEQVAAEGGASASLDHKLYGAIRAQAAEKGMRYEADAPAY